jgi:hypothetical protein
MSLYWLWSPRLVQTARPTIETFMTHGELTYLNRGTPEMVAQVLEDLGVEAAAAGWTMDRYRTGYFTDYHDSEDWRDRWQQAWRLRIELADTPREPDASEPIPTEATDASWAPDDDPGTLPSATCLILADFENEEELARARKGVAELLPTARIDVGTAYGRFPQLRIDLGERPDSFYEGGAAEAERAGEECRRHGGVLRAAESEERLLRKRH